MSVSADLVRQARMSAGISRAELSRRVRRSPSTIARWEAGVVQPTVEKVRAVARACGLERTLGFAIHPDSYVRHIERRLALTPAERVARGVAVANRLRTLRAAAEKAEAC